MHEGRTLELAWIERTYVIVTKQTWSRHRKRARRQASTEGRSTLSFCLWQYHLCRRSAGGRHAPLSQAVSSHCTTWTLAWRYIGL